jgi:cbb3-type cytochrome oxidase subunit 3
MFNQIFENIEGIEIYPLISLMIFFLFFIVVAVWIIKMNKSYVRKMEMLPLDDDIQNNKYHKEESYV